MTKSTNKFALAAGHWLSVAVAYRSIAQDRIDIATRHPTTMAKGKSKRKQKDGPPGAEGGAGPSADYQGPGESWGGEHMNQAAAPILAMHPSGAHVAVAYGKGVAIFDTATGARIPLRAASDVPSIGEGVAHTPASPAMRAPLDPSGDWHAEAIRAIAFDPSGRFLATAGDDKAVRLFAKTDEPAYECVRRWHDRKKVRGFFFISIRAIRLTSCLFAINSHPRSRSTTLERT